MPAKLPIVLACTLIWVVGIVSPTFAADRHFSDAIRQYTDIIKLAPDDSQAYIDLAEVYSRAGCHQQAVYSYEAAEKLDPMNYSTHFALGTELIGLKSFLTAETEFQYCLCLQPADLPSMSLLATSLSEQGLETAAICELQDALVLPNLTTLQLSALNVQLGSLLLQVGRTPDAVAALTAARDLTPDDPDVHVALGAALWADGQKQYASAEWKAAACSNNSDAKSTAIAWLSMH